MKIKATIQYYIKHNHSDKNNVIGGYNPSKKYEFSDTYTFNTEIWDDSKARESYMKNDLALVAGGGYSKDGIKVVKYVFDDGKKIKEVFA